jgi:hypothetical protein
LDREILTIRPAQIRVVAREEPPAEKNGSGTPVAGRVPETTAILRKAWLIIVVTSETPNKRLKTVSDSRALL